mgnify:FL=1
MIYHLVMLLMGIWVPLYIVTLVCRWEYGFKVSYFVAITLWICGWAYESPLTLLRLYRWGWI